MTETDLDRALAELDRLLNDPETRMDPDRVWSILAEVSPQMAKTPVSVPASPRSGTLGSLPAR